MSWKIFVCEILVSSVAVVAEWMTLCSPVSHAPTPAGRITFTLQQDSKSMRNSYYVGEITCFYYTWYLLSSKEVVIIKGERDQEFIGKFMSLLCHTHAVTLPLRRHFWNGRFCEICWRSSLKDPHGPQ